MPLYHTEDQVMLTDSARDFFAGEAPVSHMRSLRNAGDMAGFAPALWKQFAAMGFTSILVPERAGGLGLGHVEAGIILENIGANLTPSPFLQTAVGAVTALKAGSQAQRDRWFPQIMAGDTVISLAVDEGVKHNPESTALRAERSARGFRLFGEKTFVPHGHVADLLLVPARTDGRPGDENGITWFAVEKNAANLASNSERLADAGIAARVTFDGVDVDLDAAIGPVDAGWDVLMAVLSATRLGAAAELLGVGTRAMAMTIAYLKDRTQFGQPIGSFQALQHRASQLYAELELARSAVLKAQQLLDLEDEHAPHAAMVAKATAGLAATLAVQEGVQMHGGIGMTDAHDIGFYMKRGRVLTELYGDANFQADRIAAMKGY